MGKDIDEHHEIGLWSERGIIMTVIDWALSQVPEGWRSIWIHTRWTLRPLLVNKENESYSTVYGALFWSLKRTGVS